jgi:hypothetical protein
MRKFVVFLIVSFIFIPYTQAADSPSANNSKKDMPCLSVNGCPPYTQPNAAKPGQTKGANPPSSLPRVAVSNPIPLTAGEKFHYYVKSTYGPKSFGYSLLGAGINQARDKVPEWGQGMEGYSKRFASSFGQKVVKRSVDLGLITILHEDPRYFRSGQSGIVNRSLYAAEQVFIAHKDSGGTRFGYSNMISTFTGSYVSRQWRPDSYHSWGDCMSSFAISLGINAGKNLFNEFWPDIRNMLHH